MEEPPPEISSVSSQWMIIFSYRFDSSIPDENSWKKLLPRLSDIPLNPPQRYRGEQILKFSDSINSGLGR